MVHQPLPEGLYCPNPGCPRFGQEEGRQLERHCYYGARPTTQYLCRACGKTFTESKGTFFYRLRTPREKVLQALVIVAEQGGIRATGRAVGVDKDPLQRWVDRAGRHLKEVSAYLVVECHLSEAQLDALWTGVKKKTPSARRPTMPRRSATSSCGAA